MFGRIRACPLEIMGFLSAFGCIWQKAAYNGLWGCSIWQALGIWALRCVRFHSTLPDRPHGGLGWNQCTEGKLPGGLCVLSSHSSGSARLVLLKLSRSWRETIHPNHVPREWESRKALPEYRTTTGFQIPAFSSCGRGDNHVSGLFSSSVLEAEQQQALCFSHCCQGRRQGHMDIVRTVFVLITFWAERIKFVNKMSLSCRWQNEGYFRQAVDEQSLAVTKNETGKQ